MRLTMIGILGATLFTAVGCGGGQTFANHPRPAIPIDLSVYINDARVSVSPDTFGAGPVRFIVANGASKAESLQIQSAGGGGSAPVASTGPISPQATAEVRVDVTPGDYTIVTGTGGTSDASQGVGTSIQPAHVHVGPARPSGKNALLQP